ncbi:uncharacterized protein JCM15063_003778 [Sporobolomyces koalae]|uniref:uncharacterized protein n=1 Tax=Sporobolomyces koalae TaxID=500713 RepID=UPI003171A224
MKNTGISPASPAKTRSSSSSRSQQVEIVNEQRPKRSSRAVRAKAFKRLMDTPSNLLPRSALAAVSNEYAESCIRARGLAESDGQVDLCLLKQDTTVDLRPRINLTNTTLTTENLNPAYRHLASAHLVFADLHEVIRYDRDAKFAPSSTAHPSFNVKLAHVACLLSPGIDRNEIGVGKLEVSHLCGKRTCFKPEHLTLEDHATNLSRESCFRTLEEYCRHSTRCIRPGTERKWPPFVYDLFGRFSWFRRQQRAQAPAPSPDPDPLANRGIKRKAVKVEPLVAEEEVVGRMRTRSWSKRAIEAQQ